MKPTSKPSRAALNLFAAILSVPAAIYAFIGKSLMRVLTFILLLLELIFSKFFLLIFVRFLAFAVPLTIITILLYNILFN